MNKKKTLVASFLVGLTILAFFLRVTRLSDFLIYNDSYYFLILARNIAEHASFAGTLGVGGEVFNPLYYKWGYSLLIAPVYLICKNLTFSAQIVSLAAGVLSIPLAYLFVAKFLKSTWAGIVAALLLAVSFSATNLSGFVLSESLALFAALLFLNVLLTVGKQRSVLKWTAVSLSFFFLLAVRLEAVLVLLPVLVYTKTNKLRFKAMEAWHLFVWPVLLFAAVFLFFFRDSFATLSEKVLQVGGLFSYYLPTFGTLAAVLTLSLITKLYKKTWFWLTFMGLVFAVYFLLALIRPDLLSHHHLSGLWTFIKVDFLLAGLAVGGLVFYMLKRKKHFSLAFVGAYFLPLFFAYAFRGDYRFFMNTVPVLLVLATFCLLEIFRDLKTKLLKVVGGILLLVLLFVQLNITLVSWHPKTDYSQTVANDLATKVTQKPLPPDTAVLTYDIEAYHLKLGLPALRLAATAPYVQASDIKSQNILVVLDQAAWLVSPTFAEKVFNTQANHIYSFFFTSQPFIYNQISTTPDRSVITYLFSKAELVSVLSSIK